MAGQPVCTRRQIAGERMQRDRRSHGAGRDRVKHLLLFMLSDDRAEFLEGLDDRVRNSLILVEFVEQARSRGMDVRNALLEAGKLPH